MAVAVLQDLNDQLDQLTGKTEDNTTAFKTRNIVEGAGLVKGIELTKAETEAIYTMTDALGDVQGLYNNLNGVVDQFYANEIANIENSSISEEEKAKKIKDIKTKQFKADKTYKIGNAAMSTAQAIIGFLANPGGIAGVALSVAAGAIGAAQISAISAQPLPAFATGGSFTTTGTTPIVVGDNASGSEKVTVSPTGGDSGNQSMILSIDGQQFRGWLQQQFDNGAVRVPRRVLV